jgi:DNA ligase D
MDGTPRVVEVAGHQVRITSPEKPFFPGLTKSDVIDYYCDVADRMIKHLHARPTALERWPDGVFEGRQSFYQKHRPKAVPSFVNSEVIRFPSGRPGTMIAPMNPAAIVWAAQMNTVTFHPWPCSAPVMDRPDQLRLDFDPSPGTGFSDAVRVAAMARELLREWDWPAFCKTSGGRGVHVYVPIEPQWSFVEVRHAAIAIGRELERLDPTLITTSWWKEDRGPRVFVDFNQAAQDRTMASAYSIRANAAATVSMPVTWDELDSCEPGDFTVRTVPDLCRTRPDPWSGMAGQSVRLDEALERWNRDVTMGLPELPYPPDFPKMPGEPTRVQPSRARQVD